MPSISLGLFLMLLMLLLLKRVSRLKNVPVLYLVPLPKSVCQLKPLYLRTPVKASEPCSEALKGHDCTVSPALITAMEAREIQMVR